MTDRYNDALTEQLRKNVVDTLREEAKHMKPLDYASVSADIIGIFDPTPISDIAAAGISAARGDAVGALLSLTGVIPYVGDAIAKPAKIARIAPKTARAIERMLQAGDNLARANTQALQQAGLRLEQIVEARKKALATVQRTMLDAKKNLPNCQRCSLNNDGKRMLQLPNTGPNGRWKTQKGEQPKEGNGIFEFHQPKTLPDGRIVKEIEFRNGAPSFDKYVFGEKHDLWEITGDAAKDGKLLEKQIQKNDPHWEQPDDNYVLHHFENGQVGYVPRVIHDRDSGGVAHTGGNSMINNKLF